MMTEVNSFPKRGFGRATCARGIWIPRLLDEYLYYIVLSSTFILNCAYHNIWYDFLSSLIHLGFVQFPSNLPLGLLLNLPRLSLDNWIPRHYLYIMTCTFLLRQVINYLFTFTCFMPLILTKRLVKWKHRLYSSDVVKQTDRVVVR